MNPYVKCTHNRGNRVQECVLVQAGDRLACLPIAPSENAIGKIAAGLARTAVGIVTVRLGTQTIDASGLRTPGDLDAAVAGSGGFHVGADWTYRTRVPVIGTMLLHGDETITTREPVPAQMLALLTPHRAPPSPKVVWIACGIGGAILAVAGVVYTATGSLEALFGIGFWGVVPIAASLFAWIRLRGA